MIGHFADQNNFQKVAGQYQKQYSAGLSQNCPSVGNLTGAVEEMMRSVGSLEERVIALRERLSPFFRPSAPIPNEASEKQGIVSSQFTSAIHGMNGRVINIQEIIDGIHRDLDF